VDFFRIDFDLVAKLDPEDGTTGTRCKHNISQNCTIRLPAEETKVEHIWACFLWLYTSLPKLTFQSIKIWSRAYFSLLRDIFRGNTSMIIVILNLVFIIHITYCCDGPYNDCMMCCETCKDLLYIMFYLLLYLCICKNFLIGLSKTWASMGKFLHLDFKRWQNHFYKVTP
jgi:hypothetical protein